MVICHGLSGSRLDMGGAYVRLAGRLTEHGIAFYRFDFAGCGESDGEPADFTVSDRVSQVGAVVDRLAEHQAVDADRISLLGMSMGGLVAVVVAGTRPVRSLALWAPAGGSADMDHWTEEHVWGPLRENGYVDMGGWPVTAAFFDDVRGIDQFTAASRHGGPALLAGGAEDDLMDPKLTEPYRRVWGDRLEELLIEGVGHDFGAVAARERLLAVTEEFLSRTA
ncbi:alpha/beta hydrolase [Glycomyces tenuis]|uniref:alpha/beta hydrolase n=1 Tax=Glycomyces tenuis TaxID=58116 RepID=UPI00042A6B02|nr:alpha/beta fold hydrolase [Glycomyces tenuis]